MRSAIGPGATVDPNDAFSIVLRNANGVVYSATLQPGDFVQRGKALVFIDKGARGGQGTRNGLSLVKIADTPKSTGTRITVEAFADMSAAAEADMTLEISIGNDANAITDTWERRNYGWLRPHR
ncbi:MAG: hypothetical protein U0842_09785 [Candidatus Binatia bacterium]